MHYSVGAFEGDQLVGFILHGYDVINGVPTIYNAGTGVIGSHRGRGITKALYEFAIPLLAEQGIYTQVLEVIENNFPAMRVYEMIGFCTKRKLQAFKGKPGIQLQRNYSISHPDAIPDEALAFSDTVSAWQNSLASVDRDRSGHQLIGVFENDRLIGFAAYVAATGRIKQLAVRPDRRRRGVGTALLSFIRQESKADQLTVTNVDEGYDPAIKFLQASGFEGFLGLYEMHMQVNA